MEKATWKTKESGEFVGKRKENGAKRYTFPSMTGQTDESATTSISEIR